MRKKDANNSIRAGWNGWREMSAVICDKKVPEVLKNKIYKTAIRPAMTYGGECWAVRKCEQNLMNTRHEDAEVDTRTNKKRPHQKCYHPGKGAHKTNKHFPDEERQDQP